MSIVYVVTSIIEITFPLTIGPGGLIENVYEFGNRPPVPVSVISPSLNPSHLRAGVNALHTLSARSTRQFRNETYDMGFVTAKVADTTAGSDIVKESE